MIIAAIAGVADVAAKEVEWSAYMHFFRVEEQGIQQALDDCLRGRD